MYYKIKPDSDTHKKLVDLFERMKKCDAESIALMKEVGADSVFRSSFDKAGGAYGFTFENGAPEGWRRLGISYMPKRNLKANQELIAKIEALPRVSIIEYANIFGADVFNQPGCFKRDDVFYANGIGVEGPDFEPIKMSEWASAKEKVN